METTAIANGGMWFEDDQWWEKLSTVDAGNMRAQIFDQRVEIKMLTEALKTLADNLEWNRETNTVYVDAFEKFNILEGELAEEVIKAFLHVYPPVFKSTGDMSMEFDDDYEYVGSDSHADEYELPDEAWKDD